MSLLPKYQEFFDGGELWPVAEDIVDAVNGLIIEQYNMRSNVQKADAQIPELKILDFKPKPLKTEKVTNTESTQGTHLGTPTVEEDNCSSSKVEEPDAFASSTTTIIVTPNEMDDYKGLSNVEKALVRKFLSVINSMSELPDKQKSKIKQRLRKKILK